MNPCDMCKYKSRLWGIEYCLLDQWHGKENEKICAEYTRVQNAVTHWWEQDNTEEF